MKFTEKLLGMFGVAVEEVTVPEELKQTPIKVSTMEIYQDITQHQTEKKKKPYKGPGSKVKELRLEKGWKQHNLATIAGCTRRLISSIEIGETDAVDYQLAKRIASSLEVDVNYLWPKYSNK